MRVLLSLLLLAAVLRADDLVSIIRKFDPAAEPKGKVERDLQAEATRKAEARYGPHARDHYALLLAEVTIAWRRAQIDERKRDDLARVEREAGADHGTATRYLCDLFVACEERTGQIEKQRDELAGDIERQGGPGDGTGAPVVARQLLRDYGDHLVGLRAACITYLAGKKAEDSERYLLATALPRAPSSLLRVQIARILAPRPTIPAGTFLALAAKESDDGVRAGLAAAIGQMGERGAEEAMRLAAMLSDPAERVRTAVARSLAQLRVPETVEPLIAAMAKEEGRARYEFARSLEWMTGERHGIHADIWSRWWAEHKGRVLNEGLAPAGGAKGDGAADRWKGEGDFYYGIPQVSRKVLWIVDVSDSMRHEVEGMTRLERCRDEVNRAIAALPRGATFNVLAFSADVRAWKPDMTKATEGNKESAKEWVSELRQRSSTNIHDALREAFHLAGEGATRKNSKAAIDTIYLLSDGAPTLPDASLDDADKILAAVREWNALGRITIHCIGIGEGLKFSFLEQLAREHQGTFVQKNW